MFNNNTRKQTWAVLIIALGMWIFAGWALIQPDISTGVRPISNVAVLGAYFGVITVTILPVGASAYKSFSEKKLSLNGNGDIPVESEKT